MDDEKLILLVQANECLYNKYSVGYKVAQEKKSVWQQISAEMEAPEEMVVKRWACLRDRYVRENLPSGSGVKKKTQWPLMQSMTFIDKFITPRATRCSFNIIEESCSMPSSPPAAKSSPVLLLPLTESEATVAPNESLPSIPEMPALKLQAPPVAKKRKRNENTEDASFSEAVAAFKKLCDVRREKQQKEEEDPLYGFGQMIVATIKTINPVKQLQAMQKVTALVMEMKLEPDLNSELNKNGSP